MIAPERQIGARRRRARVLSVHMLPSKTRAGLAGLAATVLVTLFLAPGAQAAPGSLTVRDAAGDVDHGAGWRHATPTQRRMVDARRLTTSIHHGRLVLSYRMAKVVDPVDTTITKAYLSGDVGRKHVSLNASTMRGFTFVSWNERTKCGSDRDERPRVKFRSHPGRSTLDMIVPLACLPRGAAIKDVLGFTEVDYARGSVGTDWISPGPGDPADIPLR